MVHDAERRAKGDRRAPLCDCSFPPVSPSDLSGLCLCLSRGNLNLPMKGMQRFQVEGSRDDKESMER